MGKSTISTGPFSIANGYMGFSWLMGIQPATRGEALRRNASKSRVDHHFSNRKCAKKNRFGEILPESILIDFGIHSNFVADKKKNVSAIIVLKKWLCWP